MGESNQQAGATDVDIEARLSFKVIDGRTGELKEERVGEWGDLPEEQRREYLKIPSFKKWFEEQLAKATKGKGES